MDLYHEFHKMFCLLLHFAVHVAGVLDVKLYLSLYVVLQRHSTNTWIVIQYKSLLRLIVPS